MNRPAVSPFLLALLLAGGVFSGAPAQEPDTSIDGATPGSLIELWSLRRALLDQGDALAADDVEDELRSQRRLSGVARSEDLAGAFVLEGHENLELRQFPEAREAFQLALEFDPDMPQAYLGLARTEWAGTAGAWAAAEALLGAGRAALRNWMVRSVALVTALWAGLMGLVATALVLLGLLLLRTFRLVHHDLAESLQRWLPPTTARTLAALLPWLPLALPYGALWTPLLWLVLVLPFLRGGERTLVLAVTGAASLAALAVPAATAATARTADPRLVQVAGAARGGVGADRHRTLSDLVDRLPGDPVLHLLLADQARGLGDDAAALAEYERAARLDPGLRQAYNNAGALFFSRGRYATAVGQFRKAIEADPGHMVAHYNLYLTQEHRFDFAAAEQTLSRAQRIDMAAMTRLLAHREERNGRLDVIEDSVPVSLALERARAALASGTGSPEGLLAGVWAAAALPLLAMVAALLRSRRAGFPHCCASCGRIACRRCSLSLAEGAGRATCATCATLATRASSLPRRAREVKRREIQRYRQQQVRVTRLMALLVPGGGQLWSRRTVLGAGLLGLAGLGLAAIALRPLLPVATYTPVAGPVEPFLLMGAALALAAWLAGWLLPRRPAASPVQTVGR